MKKSAAKILAALACVAGGLIVWLTWPSPQPVTIGIIGVNRAKQYVSYEAEKEWPTTGVGRHKHLDETEARLFIAGAPHFDDFLILRFAATNSPTFPFTWVDPHKTTLDYGAALARVSSRFEKAI